ncbi:MAG: restriction endonuclease subunit S [Bacteroidales bacterium]|nr:restriction endonuclease subunit S [Bacteroidales bacterium]
MKNTYLQNIRYSEVHFWDVKRYTNHLSLEFDNAVLLRDILFPFRKSVTKKELQKNGWSIISKINFHGELFLREKDEIQSYKGSLNLIPENSIIYSKINVRHGCVYFHKKGQEPFAASSEYPTFTFDSEKVNGEFLKMVLRSEEFKKLLNTKTSGISKARVKVNEFLDIRIPLPSLVEQNRIVEAYDKKIKQAEELEKKAVETENDIGKYIDNELGIEFTSEVKDIESTTFLKLISYSQFKKWGVDKQKIEKVQFNKNYETKRIIELCNVSSGGTPSRSRKEYYTGNIPWIKTTEVRNDVIYNTEEKITDDAIKNSSAKLYPKDSLIIAMYGQGATRGRTAKLGIEASTNQACAVLYNINNSIIDTDYLWIYLMNEYERLRALASGNNQPNLNAQMIKNYEVVIPPFNIQQKIKTIVHEMKVEIKKNKEKSTNVKQQALKDFENEIFMPCN